MLLCRPVRRQHPGGEHLSGLEGPGRLPGAVLGRVVDGEAGTGKRRQQQHRKQGARPPSPPASPHCAERSHPKVNPILFAPAPSSQLAVTCATVTGDASVVPLTVMDTIPARARVRPA